LDRISICLLEARAKLFAGSLAWETILFRRRSYDGLD